VRHDDPLLRLVKDDQVGVVQVAQCGEGFGRCDAERGGELRWRGGCRVVREPAVDVQPDRGQIDGHGAA
jgi:hypothetical protein